MRQHFHFYPRKTGHCLDLKGYVLSSVKLNRIAQAGPGHDAPLAVLIVCPQA